MSGGWIEQILNGSAQLTPRSPFLRRSRSEEIAAAKGVLSALAAIEAEQPIKAGMTREIDGRLLFDQRLMAHKDPLARYPPVRVRCQCRRSLEWIAVAPRSDHGLQLVHGPRLAPMKTRQGGAYDILPGKKRSPLGQGSAAATVSWAEDTKDGLGYSRTLPNGPYGDVYALKAHYLCPGCHREETVLHVTLLRQFLTAVMGDEREISLGPIPGVAQTSKPSAERVADRNGARAWSTRSARRSRWPGHSQRNVKAC